MSDAAPLVLVVEDDPFQRELASIIVEESGIEVIACESAEAAIVALQDPERGRLALLFTDCSLSGRMTGPDLAYLVHSWFPAARVVVTSGDRRPDGLPEGARFIQKPWDPSILRQETADAIAA